MLKLTKKADYGLIALKHLAVADGNGTASAKEIADAYGIPLPLLAKILQKLTKTGLLTSVAGTNGGYKLARPAKVYGGGVVSSDQGPDHSPRFFPRPRPFGEPPPRWGGRAPGGECLPLFPPRGALPVSNFSGPGKGTAGPVRAGAGSAAPGGFLRFMRKCDEDAYLF